MKASKSFVLKSEVRIATARALLQKQNIDCNLLVTVEDITFLPVLDSFHISEIIPLPNISNKLWMVFLLNFYRIFLSF